ncbi:MAG: wax ester/triacylglycerol synthase family O-acyltransferase [Rhodocyclaceae bacterium]|nr:wax ester/triacylglycerol synthase family O-acyltransferase [Rhodocyclaceae bacterium]
MKHLSGMDNLFLAMDKGNQHLHVASLGVYDPSTAPAGKVRFKAILSHFSSRLNVSKVFRRRLVAARYGLDRPYWVDDAEIDIEYHVRHIALPHPGDWRQLMIQVARLHSRPLDMTKPLWEAYIIEGLDNIPGIPSGSFAMYMKMHHSAIDGEAGAAMLTAIHALTPEPDVESQDEARTMIADRDPTPVELYARALANRAQQVFDASKLVAKIGSRVADAGRQMIVSGRALELGKELVAHGGKLAPREPNPDTPGRKPQTRFDAPISANRVVDAVGFSMTDCQKIRQHVEKTTINDIFMAATSGAVRKYLEAKGELPDKGLNAMVPMTIRGEHKGGDEGNQIGMTVMPLRSDIADPLERLNAVKRGSGKNKAMNAAIGKDLPAQLIQVLPAGITELLLTKGMMALANMTVSNVRGPDVPLYMAGAQLVLFLPVSAISNDMGLNVTAFSYNGTLWVCFISCRKMMPDPSFFAQCLNESFDELVRAAIAVGVQGAATNRVSRIPAPKAKTPAAKKPAVVVNARHSKVIAKPQVKKKPTTTKAKKPVTKQ